MNTIVWMLCAIMICIGISSYKLSVLTNKIENLNNIIITNNS